jgi:Flp pilus assembly protein TadD
MFGKLIVNLLQGLRRNATMAQAPAVPRGRLDIGSQHEREGRPDEAERIYRAILEDDPHNIEALQMLGNAVKAQGRLDEAIDLLEQMTAAAPSRPEAHFHLGNALGARGDTAQALQSYDRALDLNPLFAPAHTNRGNVLRELGRLDAAVGAYRRAVELCPDIPQVHHNLGIALYGDGRNIAEATACFERALASQPDLADARLSYALALLAQGDFDRGWREYEWRLAPDRGKQRVPVPSLPYPQWAGEDLAGKSIIVWGEQGVGDQIQFAGLTPELLERADRCTVLCLPKLVALFSRSFPKAGVTAKIVPAEMAQRFDFQCAAASLARWLRPTLASFPDRRNYLVAGQSRVGYWRGRFAALGDGLKIGFSWRSHNMQGERALSCTELGQWAALFSIPGVHWICLQYDECRRELKEARARFGVTLHELAEVDMFDDLDETAAVISALDLVISAPTTVSVLAAALGIETWQLTFGADWQTHGTQHNPWYPALRRFPRAWNEDWEEVIAKVAAQLRTKASPGAN